MRNKGKQEIAEGRAAGQILRNVFFLICCAGMLSACAGVNVVRINNEAADLKDKKGFRSYEGSTYLLVFPDGKGNMATTPIFLPDQKKKISVAPYSFLASNETKLVYVNGVLTGSETEADGTAVPNAVIGAVEVAATAAAGAFSAPENKPPSAPAPELYKLDGSTNPPTLKGGKSTPAKVEL